MTGAELKAFGRKHRNLLILAAIVVVVAAGLIGKEVKERNCISRGIDYFKEIDSWPTLSTGRDAATVAQERCSRTTDAF